MTKEQIRKILNTYDQDMRMSRRHSSFSAMQASTDKAINKLAALIEPAPVTDTDNGIINDAVVVSEWIKLNGSDPFPSMVVKFGLAVAAKQKAADMVIIRECVDGEVSIALDAAQFKLNMAVAEAVKAERDDWVKWIQNFPCCFYNMGTGKYYKVNKQKLKARIAE